MLTFVTIVLIFAPYNPLYLLIGSVYFLGKQLVARFLLLKYQSPPHAHQRLSRTAEAILVIAIIMSYAINAQTYGTFLVNVVVKCILLIALVIWTIVLYACKCGNTRSGYVEMQQYAINLRDDLYIVNASVEKVRENYKQIR